MKTMKSINGILLLSASLLLSSCVTENYDCPEAGERGASYLLNIEITTSGPSSRVAGDRMTGGTEEENYINLGDYAVYILDATDEENPSVIQKFAVNNIKHTGFGKYTLTGTFTYPEEVHPIRIAVLANVATDFEGDYDGVMTQGTTLADLYTNVLPFEFTMPVGAGGAVAVKGWEPSISNEHPAGIPMFGLSNQITPKGEFTSTNHSYIPPMDIEIPMLRSLAKIILLDKTPETLDFEIISAYISNYNKQGRFIPDGISNPEWYKLTSQVDYPSLPSQNVLEEEIVRLNGSDSELYAYLPEMAITAGSERPVIEISATINGKKKTYKVPIGQYPNSQFDEETDFDILRNHRYTFTIYNVKEDGVEMVVEVVNDWDVIHNMELE